MREPVGKPKHWWAEFGLVSVTLAWGSTFIMVKDSVRGIPVYPFLALRFAIAALVLSVVCFFMKSKFDRSVVIPGILLGATLFAGYALQTVGLIHTTASKAGFITGLNVILVPLGSAVLLRVPLGKSVIAGASASMAGMILLSVRGLDLPGMGDLLVLGCAFAFALQILLVSKYAESCDPIALCTVQLVTTSLLAFALGICTDGLSGFAVRGLSAWGAISFLGICATAGAFLLQTVAQQFTSASRTALIFALEPVFAALFSWLLAGELLSPMQWGGGALIIGGIILSELGPV